MNPVAFVIDAVRLNLVRRSAERGAIRRAQNVEIGSLRARVGQVENPILRNRRFRAQIPYLRVAGLVIRIDDSVFGTAMSFDEPP